LPKDTIPAYFLYRDAPETQRHVNDRFDRRVTSSSRRTVGCALEIGLHLIPGIDISKREIDRFYINIVLSNIQ